MPISGTVSKITSIEHFSINFNYHMKKWLHYSTYNCLLFQRDRLYKYLIKRKAAILDLLETMRKQCDQEFSKSLSKAH